MTIIVEDGTIVTLANSYQSISDADNYFTYERPAVADWEGLDDEVKEASLRFAVRLLDTLCWLGRRTSPSVQELAFPRALLWDEDRRQYFSNSVIPRFLKSAQAELAIALAREDRSLIGELAGGSGLKRVKIDVLEIEWAQGAAKTAEDAKPLIPDLVLLLLDEYLCGTRGMQVKTLRT